MKDDTISRQAAIEHLKKRLIETAINNTGVTALCDSIFEDTADNRIGTWINEVPSAEPKAYRMGYQAGYKAAQRWTPCSERLPEERDWYLGIFKEPDTGWINPIPFICDYVGKETKATTKECWILKGFTDREEYIDYYFNLKCIAWMPLPEPYKGEP